MTSVPQAPENNEHGQIERSLKGLPISFVSQAGRHFACFVSNHPVGCNDGMTLNYQSSHNLSPHVPPVSRASLQ